MRFSLILLLLWSGLNCGPGFGDPNPPAEGKDWPGPIWQKKVRVVPAGPVGKSWQQKLSESPELTRDRLVVLFWTTWCPPCKREMEELRDKLTKEQWRLAGKPQPWYLEKKTATGESPTRLVLVNYGEKPDIVRGYLNQTGKPALPSLLDVEKIWGRYWGLTRIPVAWWGLGNRFGGRILGENQAIFSQLGTKP